LFPNPTSVELYADFSAWEGQVLQVQVMDSQGRQILQQQVTAASDAQLVALPAALASGLYMMDVRTGAGERFVLKFVVQR
jgi:hypothetical protein